MMKLPIDFKSFSKDPVKGLLFIVLGAVGYLYVDNRMNYTGQIEKCDQKVDVLQNKIEVLEERLRKSDSTLARTEAKLENLLMIWMSQNPLKKQRNDIQNRF